LPIVYKNKRVDIIIINDDVSNYLEAWVRAPTANVEKRAKVASNWSLFMSVNPCCAANVWVYTTDHTKTRYEVVSRSWS
jgi:hypothetical protein